MQLLGFVESRLQAGGHIGILPPLPPLNAGPTLPSCEGIQAELGTHLGGQVHMLAAAAAAAAALLAGIWRLAGQLLFQLAGGGEGEGRRRRRLWSGPALGR